MKYEEYTDALRVSDEEERGRILKQARYDKNVSCGEYIALEKLDERIQNRERGVMAR